MSTDDEARPAARLTVLSGPSGAGRGSVVELVRARFPSVWRPVPATTRPPCRGEVPGVDRLFVDSAAFDRMIAADALLEWSRTGPYRRGVPRAGIRDRLAEGRPVLLPLDLPGALAVRAAAPGVLMVLLAPPSYRPDPAVAGAFAHAVRHDRAERAADELVGLLGYSFLAPAQPRPSG
ncbi:nucleoside/nucleotide kinase family protein [Micromonospora auratinigra]|uniref:Guanylate kinase n=1 Tax=Micromonospora auratinigra TaxID=261654 RepID=A0A1A8Z3K0_9ACTN|nr:guanylate kinase [Micromonospora auratinigra]SBT38397.1 guanylate kinase [Micromonospora auratinigra]